jgi:hypothetical protein
MKTRLERGSTALAALFCAATLAGCADRVRSTVMDRDQTDLVAEQCARTNPPRYESTWQPGPQDVKQLELDLPSLNELAPAGSETRIGDLHAYDRQYFGLVVHGRRLIYINAFQDAMANKDWKYYAIVVCENSTAAWGALYDPASRSFSGFAFNGGADKP